MKFCPILFLAELVGGGRVGGKCIRNSPAKDMELRNIEFFL